MTFNIHLRDIPPLTAPWCRASDQGSGENLTEVVPGLPMFKHSNAVAAGHG